MALPFVKSVAPKVLGILGLSSLGAIASSAINKKMNKNHIIKMSDKQLDDINKNLEKNNKMNVLIKNYFKSKRIRNIFISITNVSKYNYSSSYSKEKSI